MLNKLHTSHHSCHILQNLGIKWI